MCQCLVLCNFIFCLFLTSYCPKLEKLENLSHAIIFMVVCKAIRHVPSHILIKKHKISPCLFHNQSSLFTHKRWLNLFAEPGVIAFTKQYKLSCCIKKVWDSVLFKISQVRSVDVQLTHPKHRFMRLFFHHAKEALRLRMIRLCLSASKLLMSHSSEWENFFLHEKCGLRFLCKIVITNSILLLLLKVG